MDRSGDPHRHRLARFADVRRRDLRHDRHRVTTVVDGQVDEHLRAEVLDDSSDRVGAASLYALDPRFKRCASGDRVEGAASTGTLWPEDDKGLKPLTLSQQIDTPVDSR